MAESRLIRLLPRTNLRNEILGFLLDREARGCAAKTVKFYEQQLRYWERWLAKRNLDLHDVTPNVLRRYLLERSEHHTPRGVHCGYRAIRAFLNWLSQEYDDDTWARMVKKVPAPRMPRDVLSPVPLTDVRAMLKTCQRHTPTGERDRAIILMLLDSGLRASELCALDTQDVNLRTGAVTVRHGKGGKARVAAISPKVRKAVLRYLRWRKEDAGALFITIRGTRLSYRALRSMVRRRAEGACVEPPPIHAFRRAWALGMLRNGVNVYSLQALGGWSDLGIIQRYLAQTTEDLLKAHAAASPVSLL